MDLPASFSSLSNEIVLSIAELLDCARDKAALAATCRGCHSLLNPHLYQFHFKEQGSEALLWAVKSDDRLEALKKLHEYGADINDTGPSAAHVSAYELSYQPPLAHLQCSFTPLHLAAYSGQFETVKWLAEHGASVHDDNCSNLCGCSSFPYPINPLFIHESRDRSVKWSALHLALCSGRPQGYEIAKLLISHGAPPIVSKARVHDPVTALHTAAVSNQPAVVEYLVEQRLVDINRAVTSDRLTPLHFAIYDKDDKNIERTACLSRLIALGANEEKRDRLDLTAYAQACKLGNWTAALILLAGGADHGVGLREHPINPLDDLLFHISTFAMRNHGRYVNPSINADRWEDRRELVLEKLFSLGVGINHSRTALLYYHREGQVRTTISYTPLIGAAFKNCGARVLQYLLKRGADVDATDEDGNTALAHAVLDHFRRERADVQYMVVRGADFSNTSVAHALFNRVRRERMYGYVDGATASMDVLIRYGARLDSGQSGVDSPIALALGAKHYDYDDIARYLINEATLSNCKLEHLEQLVVIFPSHRLLSALRGRIDVLKKRSQARQESGPRD
ncbi:ankyrin repeat-containing domain protein [Bombardia bombarda]|uniref:Ankyrin repeat-containing domain protein n=1 Tax=Bombardia bombarda TaxID=252184 RepID=A0AA39WHM4_9PEZI|nr:ankyrin repeat-containing domain protein [Bombardia bombarda]